MTAAYVDAARIDPFAPAERGVWSGNGVTVRRTPGTRRLRAWRSEDGLTVEHDLRADDLCDGIAAMIATELAASGVLDGLAEFENVFTGVVRSTVEGPLESWLTFYRNSTARLENGSADFSPVHRHAAGLIRGRSVVDLGSCFGFFPLRLAAGGIDVLATDVSAPTMELLNLMSGLLDRSVRTLACDATQVPLPDRCADTVTAVHLIEHLSSESSAAVVTEALRLARHRVVVAVPFEAEPTACYGHVQRFDLAALADLTRRVRGGGWRATITEHHGGWLVFDRLEH